MNIPLKTALQQHLQAERLADHQMRALMALVSSGKTRHVPADRRWLITVAIAVFSAAFSIGLMTVFPDVTPRYDHTLLVRIADEVALNHIHRKPLESESSRISDVDHFFDNLGIRLTEPDLITGKGWRLRGGRYCSIQGITAAQLRYQDNDEGIHTVYQVPYRVDRHGRVPNRDLGDTPLEIVSRGVRVSIWVDHGTLFAVASDADEEDVAKPVGR
jgi:anti-sigma factor RsiW